LAATRVNLKFTAKTPRREERKGNAQNEATDERR
jgi:hypothetical protein